MKLNFFTLLTDISQMYAIRIKGCRKNFWNESLTNKLAVSLSRKMKQTAFRSHILSHSPQKMQATTRTYAQISVYNFNTTHDNSRILIKQHKFHISISISVSRSFPEFTRLSVRLSHTHTDTFRCLSVILRLV